MRSVLRLCHWPNRVRKPCATFRPIQAGGRLPEPSDCILQIVPSNDGTAAESGILSVGRSYIDQESNDDRTAGSGQRTAMPARCRLRSDVDGRGGCTRLRIRWRVCGSTLRSTRLPLLLFTRTRAKAGSPCVAGQVFSDSLPMSRPQARPSGFFYAALALLETLIGDRSGSSPF